MNHPCDLRGFQVAEAAFGHLRSGRSPHRHHAEPGVEVYVDVQDQVAGPIGNGTLVLSSL